MVLREWESSISQSLSLSDRCLCLKQAPGPPRGARVGWIMTIPLPILVSCDLLLMRFGHARSMTPLTMGHVCARQISYQISSSDTSC